MTGPLAQMLLMELKWRVMKNRWIIPGHYIFPVTIWNVSDYADDGKWRYKK